MSNQISYEKIEVSKIETGYLVESRDVDYNYIKSAFPTWKEAVKFLEANAPKKVVRE